MYNEHKFNLLVQVAEVASSKPPAILFRPELYWSFKINVRMMMSIFYYRVDPAQTETPAGTQPLLKLGSVTWNRTDQCTKFRADWGQKGFEGAWLKTLTLPSSLQKKVKSSQENSNPSQFVGNWSPK